MISASYSFCSRETRGSCRLAREMTLMGVKKGEKKRCLALSSQDRIECALRYVLRYTLRYLMLAFASPTLARLND